MDVDVAGEAVGIEVEVADMEEEAEAMTVATVAARANGN